MAADVVLTERRDAVGVLTLNRPQAMNAITVELAVALEDGLRELAATANVIVIRGAGQHFCAGGDYKALSQLREQGPAALAALFEAFGSACAAIGELDVPVVAAVHGYAMAGGFELMQACDVAIVADDAVLADNHSNFAMVPGGGGSQRLARLVGRQRASALILTGDRLTGADAVAWGLAYRAVPAAALAAAADELAGQLAAKDRAAQAKTKRLLRDGLELPLSEGLARERAIVVDHIAGGDLAAFR